MFLWESGDYSIRSDYENYKSLSIAAESLLNEIDIDIEQFTKILNLKKENNCQFERVGYYKINNVNNGSHECYQIVTLKDTSKRKV